MNARALGDIERKKYQRKPHASHWKKTPPSPCCEWCGRFGREHQCQLTTEHKDALRLFAKRHKRTWKVELRRGVGLLGFLREAFEIIGREGLYRVRVDQYLGKK